MGNDLFHFNLTGELHNSYRWETYKNKTILNEDFPIKTEMFTTVHWIIYMYIKRKKHKNKAKNPLSQNNDL